MVTPVVPVTGAVAVVISNDTARNWNGDAIASKQHAADATAAVDGVVIGRQSSEEARHVAFAEAAKPQLEALASKFFVHSFVDSSSLIGVAVVFTYLHEICT
jgi:hypothetical protein